MQGRLRGRESPFPMIPVDEAIGEVLKQATPLEAVTLSLADIPLGKLRVQLQVLVPVFSNRVHTWRRVCVAAAVSRRELV